MPLRSISDRLIEAALHATFRIRVRSVLRGGRVRHMDGDVIADLCLRRVLGRSSAKRDGSLSSASVRGSQPSFGQPQRPCCSGSTRSTLMTPRGPPEFRRRQPRTSSNRLAHSCPRTSTLAVRARPEVGAAPGMHPLAAIADKINATFDSKERRLGLLYDEFFVPLSNLFVHTGGVHSVATTPSPVGPSVAPAG